MRERLPAIFRVPAGGALAALAPRDPVVATRTAVVLALVAGSVSGVRELIYPGTADGLADVVQAAVPLGALALAGVMRLLSGRDGSLRWVLASVVGVVLVASLSLAAYDASATGQIFLCYPVLYAASQLRCWGAGVVTASAAAADALVAFTLEPFHDALRDVTYVGTTLVAMSITLVRAGSRQERLVARLRQQAQVDPLTGLVTRRALDDAVDAELAAAMPPGTALVICDVDHFKHINDTHGHPVGDDVLVHLAQVLHDVSRGDNVIGRLGGDELAILLPHCFRDAATRRAEEFVNAVRQTPLQLVDGTLLHVSVSVGVAHVEGGIELRELYAAADASLYGAKRGGRDRVGQLSSVQPSVPRGAEGALGGEPAYGSTPITAQP